MQWNVDWKIRGKTLSKLFWIFYAISILFFHPTAFLYSNWKRSVPRSRSFLLFHEGDNTCSRTTSLQKKYQLLGGWMFNVEKCTTSQCQTFYQNYHFFSFTLPFIVHTKTSLAKPTSKLQTMHVRKLDSRCFS